MTRKKPDIYNKILSQASIYLFTSLAERKEGEWTAKGDALKLFLNTRNWNEMIGIVMYDIEDNRVRYQISKYLIKNGFKRIQKSVFIGKVNKKLFKKANADLQMVNTLYQNNDSIIMFDCTEGAIKSLQLIGKNENFKASIKSSHTCFI